MVEKRLIAVPPQLFTVDGTASGVVTVLNTRLFKVKQAIIINSNTQSPTTDLEIKRIPNGTQLEIGPKSGNIDSRSNLSAYLVADSANIFSNEQFRPKVPSEEIVRAVYEEEPTVAVRTILVDQLGNPVGDGNPLPVQVDTTVNIGDVRITAQDNDPNPGNLHSSVRISDGVDDLEINNDGSINVNVVSSPSSSPGLDVTHNEIAAVAAGVETTLVTIVAPALGTKIYKIDVSGENIALFRVKVNTVTIANKRTFFGGDLNSTFIFEPFENGLELLPSDTMVVTVLHQRPSLANFEATVMSINL